MDLGGTSQIYARTVDGVPLCVVAPGRLLVEKGEKLALGVDPAQAYLFDADGLAI